MNTSVFISPVAGAVIGYITNYIAIKMLFRPYNEKYIFGMHVPFTPGLIPKEKARIAKALGNTVGTTILSEDVVVNSLTKQDVLESIEGLADKVLNNAAENDYSVGEVCSKIFSCSETDLEEKASDCISKEISALLNSPEFKKQISSFLNSKITALLQTPFCKLNELGLSAGIKELSKTILKNVCHDPHFKESLSSFIWQFLCSKKDDERKLSEVISPSTQREIKDYISLKTPDAVNFLLEAAENEEVEAMLKQKLASAISSIAGSFIGMFIDSDDIYVKIISGITEYINNPENMPEIENTVDKLADKFFDISCGSLFSSVTSQLRENMIMRAVSSVTDAVLDENGIEALSENIAHITEEKNNLSPYDLFKAESTSENKIIEFVNVICDNFLTNFSENSVKSISDIFVKKLFFKKLSSFIFISDMKKIKKFAVEMYKKCVISADPKLYKAVNLSSVVQQQIESFSTEELEKIITEIANKELRAITVIGGILGFVIGFLPVISYLI